MINNHNNEKYNDQTMTKEMIRSTLKRSAEIDLHIKPIKWIRHELKITHDFTTKLKHNDIKLLRRLMYESRRKHFSPKYFEDAKNQLINMQNVFLNNKHMDTQKKMLLTLHNICF